RQRVRARRSALPPRGRRFARDPRRRGACWYERTPVGAPLSIVMPVYNESGVIADVIGELGRDVVARLDGAEVVVVDDGSTDATPSILDGLDSAHDWLTVIHAEQNQGHGPSL